MLLESELDYYGDYKAKIKLDNYKNSYRKGKLILVTAMNPTKDGEGFPLQLEILNIVPEQIL